MPPRLCDDQAWQEKFDLLEQFKRTNNHCRVPQACTSESGKKLGIWVSYQRDLHSKGNLSQGRIDALNSIGFCWDPLDEDWNEKFEMLEQYKEEHGNCLVPKRQGTLGIWIFNQRRRHNNLSDDRIAKLNSIGFVWNKVDYQWQENFELLEQYMQEHGNYLVPYKHNGLGSWVHNQRSKHKNNKLSCDRIAKLNSIGFVWDARKPPPMVNSSQSGHVGIARAAPKPKPNMKKSRDSPVASSRPPKRRKFGTPRNLHDKPNINTIARQTKVTQCENESVMMEPEEDEIEEENQNEYKENNLSSIVDKLSKDQLQCVASILQISHPSAVTNAMDLIKPTL